MLLVSTTKLTDETRAELESYRSATKERARQAGFDLPSNGLRVTMFGYDGAGNRTLWDLAYESAAPA